MPPIKEEILNEVDNQNLYEDLAEVWEIIKANSYTVYVCYEDGNRIDNDLIHEQILYEFILCLTPTFSVPRPCRFFVY